MIHKRKKKDKVGFIKIKNIYTSKDTSKKLKRQATDWEKIHSHQVIGMFSECIKKPFNSVSRQLSIKTGKDSQGGYING